MQQSEYNNPKSGMPAIWNVESYAFSNERVMSILQQAETARVIKALPSMPESRPAKIVWQWVMTVMTSAILNMEKEEERSCKKLKA